MLSHFLAVVLHAVLDCVEHCETCSARNWIASESIEVLHSVCERFSYFASCDDCCHRVPITDWFTHRHDVWNHALGFEAPHVRAHAPETDLDLVCDAHATRFTNVVK
jgi:hypothetical protein